MTTSTKAADKFKNAVITQVEPRGKCTSGGCMKLAPYKVAVLKTTQGRGSAYMIRYFCPEHKNAFIERATGEVVQ